MPKDKERKAEIDRILQKAEDMGLRILVERGGGVLQQLPNNPDLKTAHQDLVSESNDEYQRKLRSLRRSIHKRVTQAVWSDELGQLIGWLDNLGLDLQVIDYIGDGKWLLKPRDRRSGVRLQGGLLPSAFEFSPTGVKELEPEAHADKLIRDEERILGELGSFTVLAFSHSDARPYFEKTEPAELDTTVGYGFTYDVHPEERTADFIFRVGFFLPDPSEPSFTEKKMSERDFSKEDEEASGSDSLFQNEDQGELLVSIKSLMTFREVAPVEHKGQWGLDTSRIVTFLQLAIDSTRGALATRLSGTGYEEAFPVPTLSAAQMLRQAIAEGAAQSEKIATSE